MTLVIHAVRTLPRGAIVGIITCVILPHDMSETCSQSIGPWSGDNIITWVHRALPHSKPSH